MSPLMKGGRDSDEYRGAAPTASIVAARPCRCIYRFNSDRHLIIAVNHRPAERI